MFREDEMQLVTAEDGKLSLSDDTMLAMVTRLRTQSDLLRWCRFTLE